MDSMDLAQLSMSASELGVNVSRFDEIIIRRSGAEFTDSAPK
jgi:hypothetical protein